jgi:hypothetical protein
MKLHLAKCAEQGIPPSDPRVKGHLYGSGNISSKLKFAVSMTHSGTEPFFQIHEMGSLNQPQAKENLDLILNLAKRAASTGVELPVDGPKPGTRGYMLGQTLNDQRGNTENQLTAIKVAELIESLKFTHHDPNNDYVTSKIYRERFGGGFYRPEQPGTQENTELQGMDPYEIAAYLRLWDAAYKGEIQDNLYSEDEGEIWTPIPPPRFNFIINSLLKSDNNDYYRLSEDDQTKQIKLSFRRLGKDGFYSTGNVGWGAQGGLRYKDDNGDSAKHPDDHPVTTWEKWRDDGRSKVPHNEMSGKRREEAEPGLVFVHLIRSREEEYGELHKPSIGICIPRGGPNFFSKTGGN